MKLLALSWQNGANVQDDARRAHIGNTKSHLMLVVKLVVSSWRLVPSWHLVGFLVSSWFHGLLVPSWLHGFLVSSCKAPVSAERGERSGRRNETKGRTGRMNGGHISGKRERGGCLMLVVMLVASAWQNGANVQDDARRADIGNTQGHVMLVVCS